MRFLTPYVSLRRLAVSFFALPLLLACCVAAQAQGGVGSTRGLPSSSGGIQTIQGQIFFPSSSQTINKRVKVRLDSPTNSISQSALTDDDGMFRFTQLEAGAYTLTVEGGKEYESAVENVAIDREASSGGRIINLPIFLKLKPDASVPRAAVDLYHKGQEAARAGNSKKAVEQLNEALGIYPDFALALDDSGLQYLKLGELGKAEEIFQKLLRLVPKDFGAHLNLGIALFNQKKLDVAETHLRTAVSLNASAAAAHYYLALTLVNQKKLDEAKKELELTLSTGGDNLAQAHKYLGGLYWGERKYQQAADELEKYLKLEPKAADAERTRVAIKELRSKQ